MDIKDKLKHAILRDYLIAACNPDWDFIGAFIECRLALLDGLLALWQAGDQGDDGWLMAEVKRLGEVKCQPEFPVTRTFESFSRKVNGLVKDLWAGKTTEFKFVDDMVNAIIVAFRQAWLEGAAMCGIGPDELTPEELTALDDAGKEQFQYLPGFASAIIASSEKGDPGGLESMLSRAEMWVARYRDVRTKAAAMACANSKAQWSLGPTKENCRSCAGFNKRVYRYSVWLKNGAIPGAYVLCCKGFRCKCSLEPTSARGTAGAFPRSLLCGGRSLLTRVKEAVLR